jgi:hypothetical protein
MAQAQIRSQDSLCGICSGQSGIGTGFSAGTCILPVSIHFHSRTDHERPDGEKRHSSTLSLTSALDGGGWLTPLYPREKTRHPLYRRLGAPVLTEPENLAPTGIRSSHRPAHSESLYLLRYSRQYYSSNIPHAYFILPPSTPHNLI